VASNQLSCAMELKQHSILKYPLVADTDLWRHPKHRPCPEALGEVGKDHSPSLTGHGREKTKDCGHSVASRLLWMEHSFSYLMACVFVILTGAPCWLSPLNSKTLPTRGAEVAGGCRHKGQPTDDLATALPQLPY